MDIRLLDFTRRALAAGKRRPEIAEALRKGGWGEAEIVHALGAFADTEFPIPVPRPMPYLSAREVFIYLVLFAALYAAAFDLGALAFELINRSFPDPMDSSFMMRLSDERIRWYIAGLVIAFPLFLLTFRGVTRAVARDPTKRASRPRKWLTYLTLFVASVSLASDLMVLVYNLLGGELTVRFLLKIATVAIIAGGIFLYFLVDMRGEDKP